MSKEWLDDAKKILGHIKGYDIYEKGNDLEVLEWLIEQAEQLKELKESIYIITTARKSIYESHEQVYLIKKAVNDL